MYINSRLAVFNNARVVGSSPTLIFYTFLSVFKI